MIFNPPLQLGMGEYAAIECFLIRYVIHNLFREGFRTAATSKMEYFVILVNGFQPLTIITKSSTLDVAAVLDPALLL